MLACVREVRPCAEWFASSHTHSHAHYLSVSFLSAGLMHAPFPCFSEWSCPHVRPSSLSSFWSLQASMPVTQVISVPSLSVCMSLSVCVCVSVCVSLFVSFSSPTWFSFSFLRRSPRSTDSEQRGLQVCELIDGTKND